MSIAVAIPDWIVEQRRQLATLAAQFVPTHPQEGDRQESRHLTQCGSLTSGLETFYNMLVSGEAKEAAIDQFWDSLSQSLRMFLEWHSDARGALADAKTTKLLPKTKPYYLELKRVSAAAIETCSELARVVLVSKPEWNLTLPADLEAIVWTVRISPLAHLRAMWNLFWSAIRHPLSDTTIDLSTGRVLYRT